MKRSKSLISKFNVILIILIMHVLASFSAYSFSEGGGIYAKCDTEGKGYCREIWDFFLAVPSGYGICVTEEDGGGPDDDCCVSTRKGVVLDRGGALSDVQTSGCSKPDGLGDNPQDVLNTRFGGDWGFGRDVFIDYNGVFVLCDEVGYYTDSRGGRWRYDGSDFFDEGICKNEKLL